MKPVALNHNGISEIVEYCSMKLNRFKHSINQNLYKWKRKKEFLWSMVSHMVFEIECGRLSQPSLEHPDSIDENIGQIL